MQIRLAIPDDVTAIAELWNEGWHDGHAAIAPVELTTVRILPSFIERTKAHLSTTYVADSGEVAGFFMLEANDIYQMYVSRAGRGTGLAQQLIAEAERLIASHGHAIATLACSIGNDRAARFYEKCGWTREGTKFEQLEVSGGIFPLEVWAYEKSLFGIG